MVLQRRELPLFQNKKEGTGAKAPVPSVNAYFLRLSLVKISLQQTLKRLAVTGLITCHLMNRIMDRVKI